MDTHDLSICVPAHNEAERVGKALRRLRRRFPDAQIILVDDGSTDETPQAARRVEGVRVLHHSRNIGYGGALKTAMRNATGKVVAWYDGDGQHRAQDLEKLIHPVLADEKDVMIGVRTKTSAVGANRRPGKWILNRFAGLVAGQRVADLNCGLRCFRRDLILRCLHLLPDGFSASATSTILMLKLGYRVGYADVIATRRAGPSTVRIFRDGLRTLHLMVRILLLFEAFKFFSLLSLLQIVPGLAYGIGMALTTGRGFPVLAATVIISGVLTFSMGLICDQIVALRMERIG